MEAITADQSLKIIECPRDAMQGWAHPISTANKVRYINSLLHAGFDTIDFGSFVSPKAIPQMADTKDVLAQLDLSETKSKLLAIVANVRGAEEAVLHDEISYLGFPFSISPTFQLRNANSTITHSLQMIDAIQELCIKNNKTLVVYLSMGFGNPYGDEYNADILLKYADEMNDKNVSILSLSDTVGLATMEQVKYACNALIPAYPQVEFGVHLHTTHANYKQKLQAALDAGCKRFDGALKGIGGCPMAQDELVGNMPTERMIDYFSSQDLYTGINLNKLAESMHIASEIFI